MIFIHELAKKESSGGIKYLFILLYTGWRGEFEYNPEIKMFPLMYNSSEIDC